MEVWDKGVGLWGYCWGRGRKSMQGRCDLRFASAQGDKGAAGVGSDVRLNYAAQHARTGVLKNCVQ